MISHREPLDRPHLGAALAYALAGGPLGRRTLVDRTGLSESVVRTELGKLEAQGLVRFAKAGTALTEEGQRRFAPLVERVRRVASLELETLALDRQSRAALVSGLGQDPPSWQARDIAVREGATGTLLLRRDAEGLVMPDGDGCFEDRNPADVRAIEEGLGPLEAGDHVVIVFGPDAARAGAGLWRILHVWCTEP